MLATKAFAYEACATDGGPHLAILELIAQFARNTLPFGTLLILPIIAFWLARRLPDRANLWVPAPITAKWSAWSIGVLLIPIIVSLLLSIAGEIFLDVTKSLFLISPFFTFYFILAIFSIPSNRPHGILHKSITILSLIVFGIIGLFVI